MMVRKRSVDIIRDKSLYKSIAFTRAERKRLGLEGLLPHAAVTQAQLVTRVRLITTPSAAPIPSAAEAPTCGSPTMPSISFGKRSPVT